MLGSTEWAETHAAELKAKAVLYVNSDVNGARLTCSAEGSHALQHFVSEVARDVKDPETGASVLQRALAQRRVAAYDGGAAGVGTRRAANSGDLHLGALGFGLRLHALPAAPGHQLSGPRLSAAKRDYGVYHSAYDSFEHYRRFVDPTFEYGVALAKVAGRVMLRAAQAELIPARESDFAASIAGYRRGAAQARRRHARQVARARQAARR